LTSLTIDVDITTRCGPKEENHVYQPSLNLREVALFSGMPTGVVEKAIEQRVLYPTTSARGRRKKVRLLPLHAVAYIKILWKLDAILLDIPTKRKLLGLLSQLKVNEFSTTQFELLPGLTLDLSPVVGDVIERAAKYIEMRDTLVLEDTKRLPHLLGSEISVFELARSYEDRQREILSNIVDSSEIPEIPIDVCLIYVLTHPPIGKPIKKKARV
jgi:hypothetical protein